MLHHTSGVIYFAECMTMDDTVANLWACSLTSDCLLWCDQYPHRSACSRSDHTTVCLGPNVLKWSLSAHVVFRLNLFLSQGNLDFIIHSKLVFFSFSVIRIYGNAYIRKLSLLFGTDIFSRLSKSPVPFYPPLPFPSASCWRQWVQPGVLEQSKRSQTRGLDIILMVTAEKLSAVESAGDFFRTVCLCSMRMSLYKLQGLFVLFF